MIGERNKPTHYDIIQDQRPLNEQTKPEASVDINNKALINVLSINGETIPAKWTVATRPATPYDGQVGYNTDFHGLEAYQVITGRPDRTGWLVINGYWDALSRPVGVIIGSRGWNYDLDVFEYLDATNTWVM